jgi:Spy/CpxP family protein refolding chaperone
VKSHIAKLLNGALLRLVILLLVGCALGLSAHAQNENNATAAPQQAEQPRPVEGDMQLLPKLNLSDEQRTQLLAIAQEHNQALRAARLRLVQARRTLNQAIYAENPDQNLVSERAREVAAAQDAIIQLNAQAELKVRQVLTPQQLQTFRRLRREQREARQQQKQLEGNNPRGGPINQPAGANQSPNALHQNNGNPTPAEIRRERRQQRRQLNGAQRPPKP